MNQMILLNSDSSYTSHRLKKAIHEIKVPITIGICTPAAIPLLTPSHPFPVSQNSDSDLNAAFQIWERFTIISYGHKKQGMQNLIK